jgi:hypothetical protein
MWRAEGHVSNEVNELAASNDDVTRTDSRVIPDTSSNLGGGRRFNDCPSIVGIGFRQEEHAIACRRCRGK